MDNIEKRINQKNAINYIEGQIFQVMPFSVDSKYQDQISIKLHSSHGSTNWLNISPEDCQAIEHILLTSYLKGA